MDSTSMFIIPLYLILLDVVRRLSRLETLINGKRKKD